MTPSCRTRDMSAVACFGKATLACPRTDWASISSSEIAMARRSSDFSTREWRRRVDSNH